MRVLPIFVRLFVRNAGRTVFLYLKTAVLGDMGPENLYNALLLFYMKYPALILFLLLSLNANIICQTPTPAESTDRGTDPPPPVSLPAGGTVSSARSAKAETSNPAYVRKDAPARIPRFEVPPAILSTRPITSSAIAIWTSGWRPFVRTPAH